MGGSMHRPYRARHTVQRLSVFLLAFALACIVASAHAGVRINPTSARYAAPMSGGVRTSVTLEAVLTGTTNGVRNYNVPVPVSNATLGGLAGSVLKKVGPWATAYATIKQIVDAAGWAIDELGQQVLSGPPVPATSIPPGGTYWRDSITGKHYFITSDAAAQKTVELYQASNPSLTYVLVGARLIAEDYAEYNMEIRYPDGQVATVSFGVARFTNTTSSPLPTGYTPPAPVTNEQLGDLVSRYPDVVNAVLVDPVTGAPIHFPELVDAMNDLRRSIEAANGLDPGPDAVPKDPNETQPMESEWPTFCAWASKVCDWLDWTRKDGEPHQDLPETELDIPTDSWTSGIGGGTCPSAEQVSFSLMGQGHTFEFEWTPLCSFAEMMRPFLMVVASIVAVCIIAGLRSSGGKS